MNSRAGVRAAGGEIANYFDSTTSESQPNAGLGALTRIFCRGPTWTWPVESEPIASFSRQRLCPMPSAGKASSAKPVGPGTVSSIILGKNEGTTPGLIMESRRGYPPPRIMRVSDLKATNSSILGRVFGLRWFGSVALCGCCIAPLAGCATYHDDLVRGQHYYDVNQYTDALAVWRILEIDWDSLTYAEQSRYSYLRGMTDYKMGFRADARHWLSIAKAVEQRHPGGLDAQANTQLNQILTELNTAVYAMGPPPSALATGVELPNVTANLESPASVPVQAGQGMTPATPATSNAPAATSTAPTAPPPTTRP